MKWLWEHRKILLLNIMGSIIGAAIYEQRATIWKTIESAVGFVAQVVATSAVHLFDLVRQAVEHPGLLVLLILAIAARVISLGLSAEVRGWLPRLSKRLVLIAAQCLPETLRRRLTEEWLAELSDLDDRPLTGVLFAGRLYPLARRIR
jgi:hypothetical protein